MSINGDSLQAPRNGVLLVVQLLGATLCFIAGFAKLSGDEQMIETFDAVGIGQWFRYVTGLIEFASAILLLTPALSGIGALLLVPTTIGAILTHLFIISGSPALPIGLLIVVSVVAWGRKETTLKLIGRNRSIKKVREANGRIRFPKFISSKLFKTRRYIMAIVLDHTIVPAKDKVASANFFAEIFGLTVNASQGHFAQVQVNKSLTFDFADEPEPQSHHYAFHIGEAEFEALFGRVKAKGLSYGSGPYNHRDGQIYTRRGGRGFYFEDPNGHLLEVMTVPETAS